MQLYVSAIHITGLDSAVGNTTSDWIYFPLLHLWSLWHWTRWKHSPQPQRTTNTSLQYRTVSLSSSEPFLFDFLQPSELQMYLKPIGLWLMVHRASCYWTMVISSLPSSPSTFARSYVSRICLQLRITHRPMVMSGSTITSSTSSAIMLESTPKIGICILTSSRTAKTPRWIGSRAVPRLNWYSYSLQIHFLCNLT